MDVIDKLKTRISHKLFTGELIPEEKINRLIEACNMTPTSMGMQLTRLLIVKSPELKTKLKGATYFQPQIESCSHLFILLTKLPHYQGECADYLDRLNIARPESANLAKIYTNLTSHFDGLDNNKGLAWARNQTYITLGNLVTSATSLDIDTCPIEGFDPFKYTNILSDYIVGYEPTVLCALGYGSKDDERYNQKKIRLPNHIYNIDII